MHKIKTFALITATLILTGCGSEVNVGYVDGGKIMNEAPQIKNILDEGAKKLDEARQESDKQFEDNPDMTDEEAEKIYNDTQRKLMGINQAYDTQIRHKLDEALSAIAQDKKLDVIVESSEAQPTILKGGIDVTSEAIQKLQ